MLQLSHKETGVLLGILCSYKILQQESMLVYTLTVLFALDTASPDDGFRADFS